MFKVLVLQALSYLTDDQTEDQIRNRSRRECSVFHFWKMFIFPSRSRWLFLKVSWHSSAGTAIPPALEAGYVKGRMDLLNVTI